MHNFKFSRTHKIFFPFHLSWKVLFNRQSSDKFSFCPFPMRAYYHRLSPLSLSLSLVFSTVERKDFFALSIKPQKNYQLTSEINWKSSQIASFLEKHLKIMLQVQHKRESQGIMNEMWGNIFFIWNANKDPEIASRSWLICCCCSFSIWNEFRKKKILSTWISFGGVHENHK